MGLFSRKNPYEKDALELEEAMRNTTDRLEQRPRVVPHGAVGMPVMPQAPTVAPMPPPMAATTMPPPKAPAYGIEDAIKLMRELPDNKKEMVIAIVQKTLISAKINVVTILDDAGRKIDRLVRKNEKLAQEVRELEEAIMQRKIEMDANARDIEETREVKISFESVQRSTLEEATTIAPSPYIPTQKAS